jgi:hypothetical protein
VLHATDFVLKHRPAIVEKRIGYDVLDGTGTILATIEQVGRDNFEKTLRPRRDDATTTQLELRDASGAVVLGLLKTQALHSSLTVTSTDVTEVGRIELRNLLGKSRFSLTADDTEVGTAAAVTWRRKNFVVSDIAGVEIARIDMTKGSSGDYAHDNQWSVHIEQPLTEPLRSLTAVAVVAVDMILWER